MLLLLPALAFAQSVRVEDIAFKGNERLSSGKLEAAIVTQANPWYRFFMPWLESYYYDEDTFLMDLLRIERLYQQEGFLEAKVQDYELNYNKKGDEVNIVVFIEEGEPTTVDDVHVSFQDSARDITAENVERIIKLKPGKRYQEEELKQDYQAIVDYFANRGHPYIEARVRPRFAKEQHTVTLEWLLDPGRFCEFGEIRYVGNKHISSKAIRRGLGFSSGDVFQQNKLINAQSQVYRLELFQFVSLQASNLDERPQHIPIEVRVREASLRTLKLGLGYGSEEKFRGFAQWRHRNFLGGARILRMGAKHSTALLPLEVDVQISQPYFLSNRNDLIVRPFFKWEDETSFERRRIGAETTLNRRLTSNTNVFVSALVARDTVEAKGEVSPGAVGVDSKSIIRLGLRRDTSDQLFTPTRGGVSSGYIEESGRFLRTPSKYIKLFTEHRIYRQTKSKKSVIAARLAIGTMKPIRGSTETPLAERFYAGGNYSVRGWGRQLLGPLVRDDSTGTIRPVGGNSIIEGSIEWRRNLFGKFTGSLFLDFGNVWPEWDGFDPGDLHYAVGAGLRYNTVIGPVRFDFGWKLNKQEFDTSNYEIHFGIGQAF